MFVIRKLLSMLITLEIATFIIYCLVYNDTLFSGRASYFEIHGILGEKLIYLGLPVSIIISIICKNLGEDRKPFSYILHVFLGFFMAVLVGRYYFLGPPVMVLFHFVDESLMVWLRKYNNIRCIIKKLI